MKLLKPKGNIIMLALFVLLASGLIGILISLMMKDFFKYHSQLLHYHQASSLEKAAREAAFVMIWEDNRGFNFLYSVNKNQSPFFSQNFHCPVELIVTSDGEGKQTVCPVDFGFSLKIDGYSNVFNANPRESDTCDSYASYKLLPASQSVILPAFYLSTPSSISDALKWVQSILSWKSLPEIFLQGEGMKYSLIGFDKADASLQTEDAFSKLNYTNRDVQRFLVITNPTDQNASFCLFGENLVPETTRIQTQGYFRDMSVSRESQVTNALPDFLRSDNYLENFGSFSSE